MPTFYYCGERRLSVIHTQLQVGFSNLNYHLHQRNLCENPACSCGHSVEDQDHYFLFCNQYRPIRVKMINAISEMLVGSGIKISLELNNYHKTKTPKYSEKSNCLYLTQTGSLSGVYPVIAFFLLFTHCHF